MRKFYLFNVNDSIYNLTKDDSYSLYNSFYKIRKLNKSDLSVGINIYEQLVSPFEKSKLSKKIFDYYKECDFYTSFHNTHSYINKYRDEKSHLYVKNSYIELTSNKEIPDFFKCLKKKKNLFVIDFDNKDYFYISSL